jgi:hypothetical protein
MSEHCQGILRGEDCQIKIDEHSQDILRGTVISQIEMSEHLEQGAGSVTNLFASGFVDSGEKRLPFFVTPKVGFLSMVESFFAISALQLYNFELVSKRRIGMNISC